MMSAFRSHHLIRFNAGSLGVILECLRLQECPRALQERSKRVQERRKTPQERSKRVQEAVKRLPKRLSDAFSVEMPLWTRFGRRFRRDREAWDLKNQRIS